MSRDAESTCGSSHAWHLRPGWALYGLPVALPPCVLLHQHQQNHRAEILPVNSLSPQPHPDPLAAFATFTPALNHSCPGDEPSSRQLCWPQAAQKGALPLQGLGTKRVLPSLGSTDCSCCHRNTNCKSSQTSHNIPDTSVPKS